MLIFGVVCNSFMNCMSSLCVSGFGSEDHTRVREKRRRNQSCLEVGLICETQGILGCARPSNLFAGVPQHMAVCNICGCSRVTISRYTVVPLVSWVLIRVLLSFSMLRFQGMTRIVIGLRGDKNTNRANLISGEFSRVAFCSTFECLR